MTLEQLPLSNEEIQALIKGIEQGDPPALMGFYDATSRLVFGLILRILGDRSLAEETLLDIYTQIWKKFAVYDRALSPLQWLTIFAHRSAIARLHWSKRDTRKQGMAHGSADTTMTAAPEQQKEARTSLESMAPAQRQLLEWAYFGGLSCSEMAAQIGKPIGAVKAHIRSGLNKLGEASCPATGLSIDGGTK